LHSRCRRRSWTSAYRWIDCLLWRWLLLACNHVFLIPSFLSNTSRSQKSTVFDCRRHVGWQHWWHSLFKWVLNL
jgi:hypothetical protein